VQLGLKAEMDRAEARAKLRDMIARETSNVAPAPVGVTLRWFYENRFLPQKEQQWKITSRPKTKRFIEKLYSETLWRRDVVATRQIQAADLPQRACS